MRFIKCCWLLMLVFLFFAACKNPTPKDKQSENPADTSGTITLIRKGLDVEPLLRETDSLEILYYNNPDGDSLRYARFFRFSSTNDTAIINALLQTVDTLYRETYEVNKKCRSEGKIIAYRNNEPIKTLYFSTRCKTDCCYLYFIKNGVFYYFEMPEKLATAINGQKKKSIQP